jgi:hypothetical protein
VYRIDAMAQIGGFEPVTLDMRQMDAAMPLPNLLDGELPTRSSD